jgi:hypothetical protein
LSEIGFGKARGTKKTSEPQRIRPLFLLDGYPHRLASFLGLNDFLFQPVQPDARVNHLTYELVFAYENAASGVFGGVASMDADALEIRHAQ